MHPPVEFKAKKKKRNSIQFPRIKLKKVAAQKERIDEPMNKL